MNFAAGIKRVVLNAKQTEVVDPAALIQQYQNEIAELKVRINEKLEGTGDADTVRCASRRNWPLETRKPSRSTMDLSGRPWPR